MELSKQWQPRCSPALDNGLADVSWLLRNWGCVSRHHQRSSTITELRVSAVSHVVVTEDMLDQH